jgi:D-lyxose ketol-isomerase
VINRPNVQCSLHYHREKAETFTCIEGVVWVEYWPAQDGIDPEQSPFFLREPVVTMLRGWAFDAIDIPPFTPHRFWTTEGYAELFEASTPHSDDDVVRIENARELPQE